MEPHLAELCTFCASLFPLEEKELPSRAHHQNLGLLELSGQGCLVCKALIGTWDEKSIQKGVPSIGLDKGAYESLALSVNLKKVQRPGLPGVCGAKVKSEFSVGGYSLSNTLSITACSIKCMYSPRVTCSLNLDLSAAASARLPIWRLAFTSSSDKISTLNSWLQECELNHENCKPLVHILPKRFIDVGTQGGRPPRLVMSADIDVGYIRYATLSYCWGERTYCTTRENESSHRREISLDLIPQTLQDALNVTRHLGLRFLWIDALCIVQDDIAEWQSEASKMHGIYSGSSITIAASDAMNSAGGCFFPSSVELPAGENPDVFFRINNNGDAFGTVVRIQPRDIRTAANESVLNTRGWVLQEMVLSHRIVHFRRSGLYWECRSDCRTEAGLVFDRSLAPVGSIPILQPNNPKANMTWWRWMESYSQRQFTVPTDRLPALFGIIQHYQITTKDIPILGLWKQTFSQDLLWMRVDRLPEIVESNSHSLSSLPSWTWLSCPYAIAYDFWNSHINQGDTSVDVNDHVILVDWAVTWTFEPFTSEVKSTRLRVNGPVQEFVLSVAPKATVNNPTYLDVDDEKPDFERSPMPWRCAGQFDYGPRMSPTRYLCLLLRTEVNKRESSGWITKETFLILEPCPEIKAHRRVGIARLWGDDHGPSFDLSVRRTLDLM